MADQDRNRPDTQKKDAPGRSGSVSGNDMGSRGQSGAYPAGRGGDQRDSELGTEEEGRTGSQGDRDRDRGGRSNY